MQGGVKKLVVIKKRGMMVAWIKVTAVKCQEMTQFWFYFTDNRLMWSMRKRDNSKITPRFLV